MHLRMVWRLSRQGYFWLLAGCISIFRLDMIMDDISGKVTV